MRTITVTLPAEIADMLEAVMRKGGWENPADAIGYGIGLVEDELEFRPFEQLSELRDGQLKPLSQEELKASLQRAVESLDRGEGSDAFEFMEEMMAGLEELPERAR